MGALEAQSEGKQALQTAQRLAESKTSSGRLSAEQILGLYYAHQGNVAMFERARQRAEHAAIQQGATWQVETWATGASTAMYMRIHDAMGMKQACEQLERMSQENPGLEVHARRARGAYLLMRGRYREALPLLEECLREEPRTIAGWARAMGSLARARNRLGEYTAAREVCLRVTRGFDEGDRAYTAFHLLAETELLISEAGLGRAEVARAGIAELLERHQAHQGPLTLGEIHEAGLEIELLLGDRARAEGHLSELQRWYLATNAASLAQRCETLAKLVATPTPASAHRGRGADGTTGNSLITTSAPRVLNVVDRRLAGGSMSLAERAQKALQILVDECQGLSGALYLLDGGMRLHSVAFLNEERVEPAVEAWLRERVERQASEDVTQLIENDGAASEASQDLLQQPSRTYRVVVLTAMAAGVQGVIGAALIASEREPRPCPLDVVHSVSHHMRRALEQTHKGM
jgi:tetratricopeptide (TPR) repeat protein